MDLQPIFSMIIEAMATQGIWCLLFVWLFYQTMTKSEARENALMTVINSYNEKLEDISEILSSINVKIDRLDKEVSDIKEE